jgi:hypothetical protein
MNWQGTVPVRDRIFSILPYALPLMYSLQFGQYLFQQFPILRLIIIPLAPLLTLYQTIPFAGLIIFFALFMLVVRNENIPRFIRFNTMQAILIDILLVLCSIILSLFAAGLQGFIGQTLYNMIFLGVLAAVIYSIIQCALGRYPEIPTISDAVNMQVR